MSTSRHFYDSNPDIQYSTVGWGIFYINGCNNNEK